MGKDAKAKAASGGGKKSKKKWSKGKVRDKLANACVFDEATYDKVMKEVPNYKVITPSIVSDRMRSVVPSPEAPSRIFPQPARSSAWSSTDPRWSTPAPSTPRNKSIPACFFFPSENTLRGRSSVKKNLSPAVW